jgi:hypothetical protein
MALRPNCHTNEKDNAGPLPKGFEVGVAGYVMLHGFNALISFLTARNASANSFFVIITHSSLATFSMQETWICGQYFIASSINDFDGITEIQSFRLLAL